MNGERAAVYHRLKALHRPMADGKSPSSAWVATKPGAGKFLRRLAHHIDRRVVHKLIVSGSFDDPPDVVAVKATHHETDLSLQASLCGSVHVTANRVYFNNAA